MVKLIIILFLTLFCFRCSNSQDKNENWEVIEYTFNTGPVSPEYLYSYSVTISRNGICNFNYSFGNNEKLKYEFTITEYQLTVLDENLKNSGVLTEDIPSIPNEEIPDGGAIRSLKIVIPDFDPNLDQPPKVINTPHYPLREYAPVLIKLYSHIYELVPENFKTDAESKRINYIKNKK